MADNSVRFYWDQNKVWGGFCKREIEFQPTQDKGEVFHKAEATKGTAKARLEDLNAYQSSP